MDKSFEESSPARERFLREYNQVETCLPYTCSSTHEATCAHTLTATFYLFIQVVIRVLARYGLKGEREAEHTGVWVEGAKIAAIGLNASRWITSHGFALNIHPDLAAFESIVPCGIHGRPVTRLCNYSHDLIHDLGKPPTSQLTARECAELVSTVREEVLHGFGRVFGLDMEILEIDVGVRRGVESQIFPEACDQRLRERLKADSRRQLELVRRR